MNFSHVLHEPVDHPTIASAVRAAGKPMPAVRNPETVVDNRVTGQGNTWLTASIGLPDRLPELLDVPSSSVITIDRGDGPLQEVSFFNAPAMLTLPDPEGTVGVAAVILRPGGRSIQLVSRGPFALPVQLPEALRELESLIQAHADQWKPRARLWNTGFQQSPQRGNADAGNKS